MAQRQQTHPGRLAVSKIRDKDTNLENAGKRLSSSPAETHPFTRTVRLTIRATERFAKFLEENNENEIERELYCETSRFLCELKGLFKIGYQPSAELLTIMPELKKGIETLKAALTKHYRPDKTKRICAEIDRLINEVCDKCHFDDPLLLKDIWMYVSDFLRSLSSRSVPVPNDPSSPENITFYTTSYEALSANQELAAKMREGIASGRISPSLPSLIPCQTPPVVEIGKTSVNAIGEAVASKIKTGKRRKHTLAKTAVRARDSVREKREEDKLRVIREIDRRWRNNEGSRNKIIKKMRSERTWQARMRNFADTTLERYSKGFKG